MSPSRKNSAQYLCHSKKHQHRGRIILISVAFLAAASLLIAAIRYFSRPPVLATVNGETIYATNIDSEVARLKKATPELFTKEYGNRSTELLKELRASAKIVIRRQ